MSTKARPCCYGRQTSTQRRIGDLQYMRFYSRRSISTVRVLPSLRRRRERSALPRPAPSWTAPATWSVRAVEADGQPRTVAIDLAEWLTLQVTRHHRHPGLWVLQGPPVVPERLLVSVHLEQAKAEAETLLRGFLRAPLARLAEASPPTCPICLALFGSRDPWLNAQHIQACHGYDRQVAIEIARTIT